MMNRILSDLAEFLHYPWFDPIDSVTSLWIVFGAAAALIFVAMVFVRVGRWKHSILCITFSLAAFAVAVTVLGPREYASGQVINRVDNLAEMLPEKKPLRLAHAIGDDANTVVFVEEIDKTKGQTYFYCGRTEGPLPPKGDGGFMVVDGKFVGTRDVKPQSVAQPAVPAVRQAKIDKPTGATKGKSEKSSLRSAEPSSPFHDIAREPIRIDEVINYPKYSKR